MTPGCCAPPCSPGCIRKVIFAGDLIATDQDALNTWLSTWTEDGERTYAADLDSLRKIIYQFQEWFTDGIYMIMGNHDMRIDKKTGGQITLEMLLDDTEMQFSRYSYMYIWMPKVREWVYVCHQFNYSKTSVRLAQMVWEVVSAPDGWDNATGECRQGNRPMDTQWTASGRFFSLKSTQSNDV